MGSSARRSLEDFALALAAGLFIGSYSSIFVAAPLLAWWKEREPGYRALAERHARMAPAPPLVTAAVASGKGSGAVVSTLESANGDDADIDGEPVEEPSKIGGVPGGPPPMSRTIQPRARQQRRRKRK